MTLYLDTSVLIMLFGLLLILIGYWAPWVAHPAAGLVQNGFDLSEFVKFLPQVKSGAETMSRWLFFLPLTTVALSFSLLTNELRSRGMYRLRLVLVGVGLLLLIILIPPYPYTPDRLLGDEFRARTILCLVSWIAFLLIPTPLSHRLPRKWIYLLLTLLTLVGTASPIIQFLSIRDALSAVYSRPITIGWGMWLMILGTMVLLGGLALGFRGERQEAT